MFVHSFHSEWIPTDQSCSESEDSEGECEGSDINRPALVPCPDDRLSIQRVKDTETVLSQQCCIAYDNCLKDLAGLSVPEFCLEPNCRLPYNIDVSKIGSAQYLAWVIQS